MIILYNFYGKQNNSNIKQTICVGLIVIFWSFAGTSPTYGTITSNLGLIGKIIIHISPFSYIQQLLFIIELESYPDIYNNISNQLLTTFHFNYNYKYNCIILLICYNFILIIIAYMILKISRWKFYTLIDIYTCRITTKNNNN